MSVDAQENGSYIVTFPQDVSKCVPSVSIGNTSGNALPAGFAAARATGQSIRTTSISSTSALTTPRPRPPAPTWADQGLWKRKKRTKNTVPRPTAEQQTRITMLIGNGVGVEVACAVVGEIGRAHV